MLEEVIRFFFYFYIIKKVYRSSKSDMLWVVGQMIHTLWIEPPILTQVLRWQGPESDYFTGTYISTRKWQIKMEPSNPTRNLLHFSQGRRAAVHRPLITNQDRHIISMRKKKYWPHLWKNQICEQSVHPKLLGVYSEYLLWAEYQAAMEKQTVITTGWWRENTITCRY